MKAWVGCLASIALAGCGGRTRSRTEGCTLVIVLGADPDVVDRIAGAVFGGA